MLGWELPPHNTGGLGTACAGILDCMLGNKNLEITFVLPHKLEGYKSKYKILFGSRIANIRLVYFNSVITGYSNQSSYNQKLKEIEETEASNTLYSNSIEEEVERYGKIAKFFKNEYDLIHAHDWLTFKLGLNLKTKFNIPLVCHFHALEIDRSYGIGNSYIYNLEKQAVYESDKIVTVSEYTKNRLIQYYDAKESKITVVHNGLEYSRNINNLNLTIIQNINHFKEAGYTIITSVGRLTYQKGIDYLLKAAKKALDVNPKLYFIIVGNGDMQDQLIMQSANLELGNNVIFTGKMIDGNLNAIYYASDVFIMPSISEPFGLVALEAGVYQNALLISKQSGVLEVLQSALNFDYHDTDKIAEYILALAEYPVLRKMLANNIFNESKNNTWDRTCQILENIYKDLCTI